jgi:energy-coupling factor transporter ATP-binding protein EcfA2
MLLQETVLFSGTVADNIAYATDATQDEIVAAARVAGAHGFVSELPDGYDTVLGPRGVGLSGGQRQRIGIARVLLRDPAVLVLDEPTTGLDAASEAEVMDGLDRLMADRTTIIVTHSQNLASRAGRTLVVEDGRLLADRTSGRSAPLRERVDPALPGFAHLLDAERMAPALERSLGRAVDGVSIVDARLKPGRELVVRYDVEASGPHTAVAVIQERRKRLARAVAARAAATGSLSFDEELGALIQWLPIDIALPALALPREELLRRIEAAGVAVAADALGPELLSYKPLARAVVRLDGHVLKVYDDERRLARAARGLAVVRTSDLRAPDFEAASRELCALVQSRLDGSLPDDPWSAATEAGEVLRSLHALPATAPRLTACDELDRAAKHAAVVTTLLPALGPRLERLLALLSDSAPVGEAVLSHGDFESGQLLRTAHGPALLDLDDVCVAAPALDFANYASHVVHGPSSLDDVHGVLAVLADGYGRTPTELDWHLAAALVCRSPTPFRRFRDDWQTRVEALVEAAEEAAPR